MTKKYELTGDPDSLGRRRVRALRDIPRHGVRAGDLGGWISGEHNLDHAGDAWVGDEAVVCENARVGGDAHVCGTSRVFGYSVVCDNARVGGNAWVGSYSLVFGNARV